jgi:hypothetical protein
MPDIIGNTAETIVPVQDKAPDTLESLQAQIKKFEVEQPELAFPGTEKKQEVQATAPEAPQEGEAQSTPPPETKAPEEGKKVDVPPHMRLPDGTVDQQKLDKATQHIEKAIQSKEAALAKYKELQKKYTQLSQEVAVKKAEVEPPKVDLYKAGLKPEDFSPEFRDKLQKDMEQDFVGTWLKATTAIVRSAIDPLQQERNQEKAMAHEERVYKRLDELASKPGNEWMLTEDGMTKFDNVFKEKPYLWQSSDPYGDAWHFIEEKPEYKALQAQVAQAQKPTPVLGAGRAIPPQVSQPSVSLDAQLEQLNVQQAQAMTERNYALAAEIQKKKDKLVVNMPWVR